MPMQVAMISGQRCASSRSVGPTNLGAHSQQAFRVIGHRERQFWWHVLCHRMLVPARKIGAEQQFVGAHDIDDPVQNPWVVNVGVEPQFLQ
jgi:hypothetical protein